MTEIINNVECNFHCFKASQYKHYFFTEQEDMELFGNLTTPVLPLLGIV